MFVDKFKEKTVESKFKLTDDRREEEEGGGRGGEARLS